MRSVKAILRELAATELIGTEVEVVKASQPELQGLKGRIVNETKNTITLQTERGQKIIQKKSVTLSIHLPGKALEIEGKLLVHRPQDRLKKLWKHLR